MEPAAQSARSRAPVKQPEARLSEFRKFACPRCLGAGKVFECGKQVASNGTCCPSGALHDNCPGQLVSCRACNGTGLRGYSAPSNVQASPIN